MTIKRDPSGRRSIEVEVEVPGTPEEVWEALATGPGISSWFYPTDVGERVGGALRYHTGSKMDAPATVTVWDPPHRFRHEGEDCGPGGPPTATEWTIEPTSGGRCLVRVVHSLFAGLDDWDDQLESFEAGWPQCLAIMRLYLGHFRGQRASIVRVIGAADGSTRDAWEALLGELNARGLSPGDRWAFAVSGAAGLAGVFEESRTGRQPYAVIRLDQPAPGTAALSAYKIADRATVALSIYFYGDEAAAAARNEAAWQAWMETRFT